MGNLLVRVRIMPKEAETKPNEILDSLRRGNPNLSMRNTREEPIAFGLVALIADFLTEDEGGAMEKIENAIRSSSLVGEFEVQGASRISAEIKKK
jgi:elongation factor 1-beta